MLYKPVESKTRPSDGRGEAVRRAAGWRGEAGRGRAARDRSEAKRSQRFLFLFDFQRIVDSRPGRFSGGTDNKDLMGTDLGNTTFFQLPENRRQPPWTILWRHGQHKFNGNRLGEHDGRLTGGWRAVCQQDRGARHVLEVLPGAHCMKKAHRDENGQPIHQQPRTKRGRWSRQSTTRCFCSSVRFTLNVLCPCPGLQSSLSSVLRGSQWKVFSWAHRSAPPPPCLRTASPRSAAPLCSAMPEHRRARPCLWNVRILDSANRKQ